MECARHYRLRVLLRAVLLASAVICSPLAARHVTATHAEPGIGGDCVTGLTPLWSYVPTAELVIWATGLAALLLGFWAVRPRGARKWVAVCYWSAVLPTVLLVIALTQAVQIRHSEVVRNRQWERFKPPCRIILALPPG